MKNKVKVFLVALIVLFVTSTSVMTYMYIGELDKNVQQSKKEVKETVYIDNNGSKVVGFSKTDVLNATVEFANLIKTDANGLNRSIDDRIKDLENGASPYTVMSTEFFNKVHLTDLFKEGEDGAKLTAITLLNMSKIITTTTGSDTVSAKTQNAEGSIYLDSTSKTAYIPLDVLIGRQTGFSLEFVFIDGVWKFSPYSLVQSVKLSELVLNSQNKQ